MSKKDSTPFVGLDAHAHSIHVAVLDPDAPSSPRSLQIAHDERSLKKLAQLLKGGLLRLEQAEERLRRLTAKGDCDWANARPGYAARKRRFPNPRT